ncbi:hypothetical protein JCM10213v2_000890 [Rhodosporidiobolus nylandii]
MSSAPPAAANLSDEEAPLVDLGKDFDVALNGEAAQDPADAAADRKLWREGRQSKTQLVKDDPSKAAMSGDMEQFMAQLYDLTHSIDALEDDIDQILALRNKIATLDPRVDIGQASLRADLDALSALTTQTGKSIVSLETWLLQLHKWSKDVRKLVKSGQAGETMQEVGEIKYQLASAKIDFANAMERIREGAYKEQERRQRTRLWMARHIRSREPDIEDRDVKGLLKAAELGAADGVAQSHVTSYAGLFALQNPFTELAELTDGMRFLHDDLDREVVDDVTGKNAKKRTIYINDPTLAGAVKKSKSKKTSSSKQSSSSRKSSKPSKVVPAPAASWFGSRYGFISTMRPQRTGAMGGQDDEFERKFRYVQAEQLAAEKDLEYGYARMALQDRTQRRKKMVIALLLVVIAALILFIVLATMKVPDQTVSWQQTPDAPSISPQTVTPLDPAAEGQVDETTLPTASEASETKGLTEASSASSSTPPSASSATSPSNHLSSSPASSATASTPAFNNGLYSPATQTPTTPVVPGATTAAAQQATVWWTPASA